MVGLETLQDLCNRVDGESEILNPTFQDFR